MLELTNEEIVAKMQTAEKGSAEYERYATALLVNNEKAIHKIASQYANFKGATLEDNIQDLSDVMLYFADIYDVSQNAQFITYFMNYAGYYLQKAIRQYDGTLNVNVFIKKYLKKLKDQGVTDPTQQQFIDSLGESRFGYYNYLGLSDMLNLDDVITKNGSSQNERTLHDVIRDKTPTVAERWVQKGEYEDLYTALDFVPEKFVSLLNDHYFNNKTKLDIGRELGISCERGRQLVDYGIEWVKFFLSGDGKDYIQKQKKIKRLYEIHVVNQGDNERAFLSRLPYSAEEILDMIDICYCKYSNDVLSRFYKKEEIRQRKRNTASIEKEYFYYLPDKIYRQIIDIIINRLPSDKLQEKHLTYDINLEGVYHALEEVSRSPRVNYLFAVRSLKKKQADKSYCKEDLALPEQLILFYNEGYNKDQFERNLSKLPKELQTIIQDIFCFKKPDIEVMRDIGYHQLKDLQKAYKKALEFLEYANEKCLKKQKNIKPTIEEEKRNYTKPIIKEKSLPTKSHMTNRERMDSKIQDVEQELIKYFADDTEKINFEPYFSCMHSMHKTILTLFYSNRMTPSEIADQLKLEEKTVTTCLSQAKSRLAYLVYDEKESHLVEMMMKNSKPSSKEVENIKEQLTNMYHGKGECNTLKQVVTKLTNREQGLIKDIYNDGMDIAIYATKENIQYKAASVFYQRTLKKLICLMMLTTSKNPINRKTPANTAQSLQNDDVTTATQKEELELGDGDE